MNKRDLVRLCRYYDGKDDSGTLTGNDAMFYFYEQKWVQWNLMIQSGEADEIKLFGEMLDDYNIAGLADFESRDDTPKTLKALLFNRYNHWCQGDGFKEFYLKEYRKATE